MEFDKSRVYMAANADELPIGSKCIFADAIEELEDAVKNKQSAYISKVKRIAERGCIFRFVCENHSEHNLAYLLKEPQYKPFSSVEKAMEAINKHGGWVKSKGDSYFFITSYDMSFHTDNDDCLAIFFHGRWHSRSELFNDFVFADDGSQCGELMEE